MSSINEAMILLQQSGYIITRSVFVVVAQALDPAALYSDSAVDGDEGGGTNKKRKNEEDQITSVVKASKWGEKEERRAVAPPEWWPTMPGIAVGISPLRGRHLYATKAFEEGSILFKESPLKGAASAVAEQIVGDPRYKFLFPVCWPISAAGTTMEAKDASEIVSFNAYTSWTLPDTELLFLQASLFNHDCRPNVDFKRSDDESACSFYALCAISPGACVQMLPAQIGQCGAGDELTISYVDNVERTSKVERQLALGKWIQDSSACCSRCASET